MRLFFWRDEMSDYSMIVGDDDLCVFVNWSDPTATVYFRYGWNDERDTPFQTSDFNVSDTNRVLRIINSYAFHFPE